MRLKRIIGFVSKGAHLIKALMVDVDGVLIGGRPADGKPWATNLESDLGVVREDLQREFFRPYWGKIVIGQAGLREHLEPVLQRIAPATSYDDFLAYWFENDALLNRRLLEELRLERLSGTRVYLATNQEHTRAAYLAEKVGLQNHCDGIFYSAAIGHKKPESDFFDKVAARVGLPPEQLALIDDTRENVVAARQAGWGAIEWGSESSLSSVLAQLKLGIESAN
jgi:putative hydrolase of the HAD superfamily